MVEGDPGRANVSVQAHISQRFRDESGTVIDQDPHDVGVEIKICQVG
jgi:predicted lipid-binding transport protein (Tim44 family)